MSTPDNPGGGEWPPPSQQGPYGAPPPNSGYGSGPGQGGYGQGYGNAPSAGYGGGPPGGQIPSNLVWAILTTIFCCLPFGIVSIVFAAQVSSKQAVGDYAGAMDSSRKARTWAIAAAVSGVIATGLAFALGIFGTILGASTSGVGY